MKRDTGIDFHVRTVSHEAWTFAGTHNVYFDNKVSVSASIEQTIGFSLSMLSSCNTI